MKKKKKKKEECGPVADVFKCGDELSGSVRRLFSEDVIIHISDILLYRHFAHILCL
jgi:hypothetical protein